MKFVSKDTKPKPFAVVTICAGDLYQRIGEITHPSLQAYAMKCNADFIVMDKIDPRHTCPGYQKLELREFFEVYERVLYVDSDIIIREDAPDLFQAVPVETVALYNEGANLERRDSKGIFMPDAHAWVQDRTYYNTGVMLVSRCHIDLFIQPAKEVDNFYEQTHLNWRLHQLGYPVFQLHHKFNRMMWVSNLTGENRLDSYFLHYAGQFSNTPADVQEMTLRVMREDLLAWKEAATHQYPKHIYIETGGGLGDVVASEPVVRHLIENLFEGDNFILKTEHPDAFHHLRHSNVTILGPGESTADPGALRIKLSPAESDARTLFATPVLCHMTDYSSLMAFHGQLSADDKRIRLPGFFNEDPLKKHPGKAVLIHAGRSWPSKTFPTDWWQEVINELHRRNTPVILIGHDSKEDSTFGVLPVELGKFPGSVDLRNQLSLKQLIAVVARCTVLLSNDSAPIHIAGAFDNWIGLLATAKAPHLILPYRYGTQTWKAEALNIGLIERNYQPGQLDDVRADHATVAEVSACLPHPHFVAAWAAERAIRDIRES